MKEHLLPQWVRTSANPMSHVAHVHDILRLSFLALNEPVHTQPGKKRIDQSSLHPIEFSGHNIW